MAVHFKMFKSSFQSWDCLFQQAGEFATNVGRERLIGISHSCGEMEGVVTVWFWQEDGLVATGEVSDLSRMSSAG